MATDAPDSFPRTLFRRPQSERAWMLVILLVFVWRLSCLVWTPGELIPDEAYYWDWSRRLDWGYYSKPPLIAWIIAASTSLLGNREWAVRLPAVTLSTAGLIPVFLLTRQLYSLRAAGVAVVSLLAAPGVTAASLFMTIDAPFLCAWCLTLWSLWNLLESRPGQWRWVPVSIAATAFGLLSKQTMAGVFPLLAIFLLLSVEDRRRLRDPRLWSWASGSLLSLTPVVWWNLQHHGLTWQHTREHFRAATVSPWKHLTWAAEFVASQLAVISPVILTLILIVCVRGLFYWRPLPRREKFLLVFGLLPLAPVLLLSLFQRVQPNWPAAFQMTGFVLLGGWVAGDISLGDRHDRWRATWQSGAILGFVLSLLLYGLPVVLPVSPLAGSRVDPTTRIRGWRALGEAVAAARAQVPADGRQLVIAATARGPVSELAFYLPDQPRVYRWNPGGQIDSQHEVWGGPAGATGASAIIVTPGRGTVPPPLASAFDEILPLAEVRIPLGNDRFHEYSVWHAAGFHDWPPAVAHNEAPAAP